MLTVYLRQGNRFDELSMNAPNLYYFFRYNLDVYAMGVVVGLILTAIVSAVLAYLPRVRKIALSDNTLLLAATMFLALSPFLLPKMHDRYFFAADMFAILLAFYLPRLWFVPVFLQMSSLAAYVPIILTSLTGHMDSWALPFAAMLNAVTIGYIVVQYVRTCLTPNAQLNVSRPFIVAWITVILVNLDWLVVAAGHALALESLCPSPGVIDALVCQRDIPLDVKWGTWRHWAIYAALFVTSFIVARVAVAKTQHWPWARWTAGGRAALKRLVGDADAA